jgi:hypothetical protein
MHPHYTQHSRIAAVADGDAQASAHAQGTDAQTDKEQREEAGVQGSDGHACSSMICLLAEAAAALEAGPAMLQ